MKYSEEKEVLVITGGLIILGLLCAILQVSERTLFERGQNRLQMHGDSNKSFILHI